MPPGTIDTSALATDNINNPRNMNAIYQVGIRLKIAVEEELAGGNLDMPGTTEKMKVPHVLKDGADSIGVNGALARVYISIGSDHEEWTKHFNLLVGGKKQTPYSDRLRPKKFALFPRHDRPAGQFGEVLRGGQRAASARQGPGRRALSAGQRRYGGARPASVRGKLRGLPCEPPTNSRRHRLAPYAIRRRGKSGRAATNSSTR